MVSWQYLTVIFKYPDSMLKAHIIWCSTTLFIIWKPPKKIYYFQQVKGPNCRTVVKIIEFKPSLYFLDHYIVLKFQSIWCSCIYFIIFSVTDKRTYRMDRFPRYPSDLLRQEYNYCSLFISVNMFLLTHESILKCIGDVIS